MHDKEKRNTANVNEDIHILMTCVRNSPKLHESPLQFCLTDFVLITLKSIHNINKGRPKDW